MKKAGVIIGIAALLALVLWGIQNRRAVPDAAAERTVKIGAVYPLSGNHAIYGEAGQAAVKIFFDKFNQQPRHFQYEVVFEDTAGSLSRAVPALNKLVYLDKADVLITLFSNFGAAVKPIAAQRNLIHFNVGADRNNTDGVHNFMAADDLTDAARLLQDKLLKEGHRKIDIVCVNTTGAIAHADAFKTLVERENKLAIGRVHYVNQDEKDFRIMIAKMKANQPDAVVLFISTIPTVDIFLRQYKDANVRIPFTGINLFAYLKDKSLAEGAWAVRAAPPTSSYEREYAAATGSDATTYAEYMDVLLHVLTDAYEHEKTKDPARIGGYLSQGGRVFETAVGTVKTDERGATRLPPALVKIQDGKVVRIEE